MPGLDIEFINDPQRFVSVAEEQLEQEVLDFCMGKKPRSALSSSAFLHVSGLRENALAWYPFKPNSDILEVGGELGALSGLLSRNARKVISLEYKPSRAELISKRYAGTKNIEVVNCNPAVQAPNTEFDYIVVSGIFGYAAKYLNSATPQVDMLKMLKERLKPNGALLLLCDNRLGIKYFGGAMEEYSKRLFTGLNRFDGYDKIRTFTMVELERICQAAGLTVTNAFYLSPSVYDVRCVINGKASQDFYDEACEYEFERIGFSFFDERRILRDLCRLGVNGKFSNGFLLELTAGTSGVDVMYAKSRFDGPGRRRIWEMGTKEGKVLDCGGNRIPALSEQCPPALRNGAETGAKKGTPLRAVFDDLLDDVCAFLIEPECAVEQICRHVRRFSDMLVDGATEMDAHICGVKLPELLSKYLCRNDMDPYATFSDIYICEKGYYASVWRSMSGAIPVGFVVYSMVYRWYERSVKPYHTLRKKLTLEKLLGDCGISAGDAGAFRKWREALDMEDSVMTDAKNFGIWRMQPSFIYAEEIESLCCGASLQKVDAEAELLRSYKESLC